MLFVVFGPQEKEVQCPLSTRKKLSSRLVDHNDFCCDGICIFWLQARIKKIMQSDEEVGKVAAAVPVIISRALELFVETLLKRMDATMTERGARTMTPGHL